MALTLAEKQAKVRLLQKQKQVRALQAQKTQLQSPAAKEPESKWEDFGEGVVSSFLDTGAGIVDAASRYSGAGIPYDPNAAEPNRVAAKDWREDAGESWAGTGGKIVGDVVQIGAGAGPRAGLLADAVASAGLAGIREPKKGNTRLGNMGDDAVASVFGSALQKTLGKLVRGADTIPEATKLLDEGVPLTPSQATDSGFIGAAEYAMQAFPVFAKGRNEARDQAGREWGKYTMQQAAPRGVTLTGTAREAADQLKNAYDTAYGDAWSGVEMPAMSQFYKMLDTVDTSAKYVGKDGQGVLRRASDDVAKLADEFNPKALRTLDHKLKKQIRAAARSGDVELEGLDLLRGQVREILPVDKQAALKELDSQYGKYLVVKKAGAKAKKTKGEFTAAQFMDSVGQIGGETRTFTGAAPLQSFADDAMATVGQQEPSMILDLLKGTVGKAPTPQRLMDWGGRATLGRTPIQQKSAEMLSSPIAQALRKGLPTAGATAAAANQENE